jgi:serpin B
MYRPHLDSVVALHQQLPAEGNLCWSPYSVAAALGLAAAGARGATRDQLAGALAPGGDLAGLGRILADSAALPEAELAVANTLWMARQLRFLDDYQQVVRDLPGGAVRTAEFRTDPDGARTAINDDVARTTRDLIQDLLAEGMITPETVAVIVNALYLKVAWLSAFEAAATGPADFHAPSGTRPVPTMRQQESLQYAIAGGWRMVTLHTASQVVVDVLLPAEDGTPLTAGLLAGLQQASRPTKVDLWLPRFRVERAAVLNDPLRRLGVTAAFQRDTADFSGITTDARIFIDLVMHKAVLRVDEQGFEGAAATAVVMRMVSVDLSTPVPFHADRPFLVLIRQPRTGAVYFVARVTEP